jgi:hypothetical protein
LPQFHYFSNSFTCCIIHVNKFLNIEKIKNKRKKNNKNTKIIEHDDMLIKEGKRNQNKPKVLAPSPSN